MGQTSNQLKRDIGFFTALSIVIGTVIGSGVFMKPGIVLESSGNTLMALAAWLIGGLFSIAGGLTIAEVGAQIPKTGGLYTYIDEIYGKFWGYLSGWIQTAVYGPAIIAALGLYLGSLHVHLFNIQGRGWEFIIAIGYVLFLMLVNIIGTKYSGWVQNVTTVAKLIPIAAIIIFGLWKGEQTIFDPGAFQSTELSFGAAVLATLFAYDGWILLAAVAGEMKNPSKLLPKAILGGLSFVTAVYLLVNAALFMVLPAGEVVELGENAAGAAADILFGQFGGLLITIGIIVSIFGTLNSKILGHARVPFAMGERKQLPFADSMAKIHPRFKTPHIAIIQQSLFAIFFMFIGDPNRLTDISVFAIYIFYIFGFYAVFTLRKRNPGKKRPYSVPLYPWIPILSILSSVYVIYAMLTTDPMGGLLAVLILLLGLPIYYYLQKKYT